jgi:hypothetical protein
MDENELARSLQAAEIEALGPMPAGEDVSPTTDRDDRTPAYSGEVHYPGILPQSPLDVADDDPFLPPRSLTEDD